VRSRAVAAARWCLIVARRLCSLALWAVAGALFVWCCVVTYCAAKCWPEAATGPSTAVNALELLAAFLRDARERMATEAGASADGPPASVATPRGCHHGGVYATCGCCGAEEEIASDERLRRQRAGMKLVN